MKKLKRIVALDRHIGKLSWVKPKMQEGIQGAGMKNSSKFKEFPRNIVWGC